MRRLVTSFPLLLATALTLSLVAGAVAEAADKPAEVPLTIEKQKFEPAEVKVKAGAPFVLVVTNKDSKPAEVENKDLKVEKVVAPGKTVSIRVRALKPGSYVFVDDFNKSAQVKIVAE
jgi:plastocyanin